MNTPWIIGILVAIAFCVLVVQLIAARGRERDCTFVDPDPKPVKRRAF